MMSLRGGPWSSPGQFTEDLRGRCLARHAGIGSALRSACRGASTRRSWPRGRFVPAHGPDPYRMSPEQVQRERDAAAAKYERRQRIESLVSSITLSTLEAGKAADLIEGRDHRRSRTGHHGDDRVRHRITPLGPRATPSSSRTGSGVSGSWPVGDVQYQGRELHFTPAYLQGLANAFKSRAYDRLPSNWPTRRTRTRTIPSDSGAR